MLNEPDVDVDSILLSQVGINVRTLARKAGKLILTTYDAPEPEPTPTEVADGPPDHRRPRTCRPSPLRRSRHRHEAVDTSPAGARLTG